MPILNPFSQNSRLLNLKDINTYLTAIFMFKSIYELFPSKSHTITFVPNLEKHSHDTRQKYNIHQNHSRTKINQFSIKKTMTLTYGIPYLNE